MAKEIDGDGVQSGGAISENEPVQSGDTINESPVHSPSTIHETQAGVILDQSNDPVFIALIKEKKRNKRLRRLLTENKNRSTVDPDSTTSPGGTEPGSEGTPAPVLETPGGGKKKRDPITGALNFLGKGRKTRDGP